MSARPSHVSATEPCQRDRAVSARPSRVSAARPGVPRRSHGQLYVSMDSTGVGADVTGVTSAARPRCGRAGAV
eukprot:2529423-Pyramimonas_sp.AAC.1